MERRIYTKDVDVKTLFWRFDRAMFELRFGDQRRKTTNAKRVESIKEKIKEMGISLDMSTVRKCRFRQTGETYIIRLI